MGTKQRAPLSGNTSGDNAPPFLPLEEMGRSRSNTEISNTPAEQHDDDGSTDSKIHKRKEDDHVAGPGGLNLLQVQQTVAKIASYLPKQILNGKKVCMMIIGLFFVTIIYQSFFVDPQHRLLPPDFADQFLLWVEQNPGWGLGAISIVIAVAVVTMVPIGTPLTLGCGYIYRGVYGWKLGLFVATAVSMAGSCLGAVICFLLGRYLMREMVQQWVRKYPLFDAINVAAKEQGFKIMAMLYLTPVIPLGLVSYMCGTTSMNIYSFAVAKIFALPLYLIYTFMGASAHSFVKRGAENDGEGAAKPGMSASDQAKQLEENQFLLLSGLLLSIVMMTLLTRHIRKELMKILEQQKKEKPGSPVDVEVLAAATEGEMEETGVELGLTARRRGTKHETAD